MGGRAPRLNQVANFPDRDVLADARDTHATGKFMTPAANKNAPGVDRRTSLGFKRLRKSQTQRQRESRACRERCLSSSVGVLFVSIGAFIMVLLPVQLNREYCNEDGWQKSCLLSARPLFSFSTCPCTMLEYKCGADVELGWEHAEVLFGCKQNASDYDYSSYSPTTVRFCDSNNDCNNFAYCNANGRCANCNLCGQVRAACVRVNPTWLLCLTA